MSGLRKGGCDDLFEKSTEIPADAHCTVRDADVILARASLRILRTAAVQPLPDNYPYASN